MKEIDPDGVDLRKKWKLKRRVYYSARPDETWSYDDHDTIVKYGLPIHGCVDVWSGKFIWLKVFTGNHEPKLIAKYFLESIASIGSIFQINKLGFPYSTRSDCGTETVVAVSLQHAFDNHVNSDVSTTTSHRYVPSTRNQNIESAWGVLFKGYWQNYPKYVSWRVRVSNLYWLRYYWAVSLINYNY